MHRHEDCLECMHDSLSVQIESLRPPVIEEPVVVVDAPVVVTEEETPPVVVNVDVNVDTTEEPSSHEEPSHEETDEETEEVDPPEGEVVITDDAGLPELSDDERDHDRPHSLPMAR